MKRFFFLCKCTKRNPIFMVKLLIAGIMSKLWRITKREKLLQIEEYIMCNTPYTLYTPYGTYYCSALLYYVMLAENTEKELQELMRSLKGNNKDKETYCINVGANIGRFAIDAALNYNFNVIAFEPSPFTYRNFRINSVLSGVDDKIESYNIGLGNTNSDLSFVTGEKCDTMAHFIEGNDLGNKKMSGKLGKTISVPVKKFDDLKISDEKIKKTRLIIIDTEGYDYNVLLGMKESLKKFNDVKIVVEIWEHKKEKNEILSFMQGLGYETKQLATEDYLFYK